MAPFCSSVPVSHASMTVSEHEQYQDPETEAAKWNSAMFRFVIYTCGFTVTCQNIFCENVYYIDGYKTTKIILRLL